MINPLIEKEIYTQLNKLSDEQQQQVLDFARFLGMKNPVGVPGKELLQFGGSIPKEDLQEIAKAIEEEFGKLDEHE